MIAAVAPLGPLDQLIFWSDGIAVREGILALAALVAFLFTAPRGRAWLSWLSIALLALSVIPLIAIIIFPFPKVADADHGVAHHVHRFLLLASFLQSSLLLVVVSVWERFTRPIPKIFIDVLRCLMLAVALPPVTIWLPDGS